MLKAPINEDNTNSTWIVQTLDSASEIRTKFEKFEITAMSLSRRGSYFEVDISEDEQEEAQESEFLEKVPEETEERDQIAELRSSSLNNDIVKASGKSFRLRF